MKSANDARDLYRYPHQEELQTVTGECFTVKFQQIDECEIPGDWLDMNEDEEVQGDPSQSHWPPQTPWPAQGSLPHSQAQPFASSGRYYNIPAYGEPGQTSIPHNQTHPPHGQGTFSHDQANPLHGQGTHSQGQAYPPYGHSTLPHRQGHPQQGFQQPYGSLPMGQHLFQGQHGLQYHPGMPHGHPGQQYLPSGPQGQWGQPGPPSGHGQSNYHGMYFDEKLGSMCTTPPHYFQQSGGPGVVYPGTGVGVAQDWGNPPPYSSAGKPSLDKPPSYDWQTGVKQSLHSTDFEEKDNDEDTLSPVTKILVSDLPGNVDEDFLEMFFENEKKFGGGPVASVQLNQDLCQAVIDFHEPTAVNKVLDKLPIKVKNKEVYIEKYIALTESDGSEDPKALDEVDDGATVTLRVTNIPEKAFNEEHLALYFEKKSGCNVVHIQLIEEDAAALIQFDTPEAVDCIMNQQPLKMYKTEVEITRYYSPNPMACDTIEVWGEDLDEDTLEMYFESEKRSGGGPIDKVDLNQDGTVAYIKFQSEEVAQRVAERALHMVSKQQMQVKLYQPLELTRDLFRRRCGSEEASVDQTDGPVRKNNDKFKRQGSTDWAKPRPIMKVEGMNRVKSHEAVQYYFENKRKCGGGEIDHVRMDEEDSDVMYVTFKSEQDAQRVVKKTNHVVEGCELSVSLFVPPPSPTMYENRLIVQGIKPTTSQEQLFDFLREKSGGAIPVDQQCGEREDMRLVTFQSPIDFERLQRQSKVLDEATLEFQRVPVSNCIYVTNYDQSKGKEALELYFENERKSGGGSGLVEEVIVYDQEGYSLVYFVDHEVVEKILHRDHVLYDKKLGVQLLVESLGLPRNDGDIKLCFEVPYCEKIRFILNSGTSKRNIESKMEQLNANIRWPSDDTQSQLPVNIECTLRQQSKKSRKTAKEWRQKAEKTFKEYLQKITVSQIFVKPEQWSHVMRNLQEKNITDSDDVVIFHDEDQGNVTVAGNKKQAEQLSKQIKQIMQTKVNLSELVKHTKKETVRDLKPLDTKMLLAMKFLMMLEERYKQLKVKIKQDKNEVIFKGAFSEVAAAKQDLHDMKDRFAEHVINDFPRQKIGMYQLKEVRQYIVQLLDQRHLTAVWEVNIDNMTVCCPSRDTLPSCLDAIREAVNLYSLPISKASRSVINTGMWDTMVQDVQAKHPRKVMIDVQDMSNVSITSTNDVEREVVSIIKQFLTSHTIVFKKVQLKSVGISRLLNQRYRAEVENIAKSLSADHVQIASSNQCIFNIRGNERGVKIARSKLSDLASRAQSREHKVSKPGLGPYISQTERSKTVGAVESQLPCVLLIRDLDEEEPVLPNIPGQASPQGHSSPRGQRKESRSQGSTQGHSSLRGQRIESRGQGQSSLRGQRYSEGQSKEGKGQASPRGHRKEWRGETDGARPGSHRKEVNPGAYSMDAIEDTNPGAYSMDAIEDTSWANPGGYNMDSMAEKREGGPGGYNTSNLGADMPSPALPQGMRLHTGCETSDGRRLFAVEGDITEMSVDILVNTADKKLSLAGGLGKVIVRKGGTVVRKACSDYIAKYSTLEEGAVFLSPGGNLKAGEVVHVVGPAWQGGQNREEERLSEAVSKVMQQAAMKGVTSIAFPAISCGTFGFPSKVATSVIVKGIQNYFREDQDCLLRTIYLCDVKRDTIEGFTVAMSKCFGSVNTSPCNLRPPPSPKQHRDRKERHVDVRPTLDQQYQLPSPVDQVPHSARFPGSKAIIGNITITIVKGELAKQKVGAIVNSTSEHLDLSHGAVSRSLLSAAGPGLQDEVRTQHPGRLMLGNIVVTRGYNLGCDVVMHTAIPPYDYGPAVTTLQSVMDKCLTEADSRNLSSVAFPALGTGNLKFPKDVVAKEMFMAVEMFVKKSPRSSITEVMFVVYHRETATIKAFEAEEAKWLNRVTVGARERGYDIDLGAERLDDNHAEKGLEHESGSDMFFESINSGDLDCSSEALQSPTDTSENKFGDITVTVKSGDITMEACDCIVNSSNEDLDLSIGSVSKALLKKGGKQLESELKRKRGKMRSKGITKTKAPGLQCAVIIHIVAQHSLDGWRKITIKCLQYAERKKIRCIAFPALGTGISMMASDIAEVMLCALKEFSSTSPKHVREVRFVIFQWLMEQDFHQALRDMKALATSSDPQYVNTSEDATGKTLTSNTVTFIVYAMSQDDIGQAISKLESILDKAVDRKVFRNSTIMRLDASQISQVKQLVRESNAEIQFDERRGAIEITGMQHEGLLDVTDKIYRVVHDADDREHQRNEASLISNITQWFYIEITTTEAKLVRYDQEINWKIEKGFQAQKSNVEYVDSNDGQIHVVDFNKMEEYLKSNPTDIVQVIRRDLLKEGVFEPPASWSPMGHTENLRVVPLRPTDQENIDMAKKFIESAGQQYTVTKIERIQNKTLWQQYVAKKKQLEQQNPPGTQNEQQLWHGFAVEAMDSINAHGFNRSYCGKNATVYGDGVYFAVQASYSCNDTYSRPDKCNIKRMYYCRVLTGVYTRGERGMRWQPKRPTGGENAIYDSVVNSLKPDKLIMYVIFNDTQAYPEYIISFRK